MNADTSLCAHLLFRREVDGHGTDFVVTQEAANA